VPAVSGMVFRGPEQSAKLLHGAMCSARAGEEEGGLEEDALCSATRRSWTASSSWWGHYS